MARRDLIAGLETHYFRRRRAPRVALVTTGAALAVVGAIAATRHPAPPVRTAIRVDCTADSCARAEAVALDVWSEDRGPGQPLDVVVDAGALAQLRADGVAVQILVPDIDAVAAAEAKRLHAPAAADRGDWFSDYRDYRAIGTHLHELAELAPDIASTSAIGTSLENRPIWALHIRGRSPEMTPMLIDGTQHAREWIAAMTTTCVADRLVRGYATDPAIRAFVDHIDLWVVPVVNPDGYQFSWSTDRYWRKNRRDTFGVDLNRNFSVGWGGVGSSRSERSEIYRGAYAFSEPESAALRDLAKRVGIAVQIDFHAYGQLLLYPWSYSPSPAKDRDRLTAIGDRMATAMFVQHETRYTLASGIELYPAAGTAMDWMYGEAGALAYTIELRPKGGSGFVLPPDQIRPTCDEGLAAVLALGSH